MTELKRTITVSKEMAKRIEKLLSTNPEQECDCFGEDEIISFTADFGKGMEVDVKVCGVRFENGGNNMPWTEAVLFSHGCEVCCTEPDNTFFSEWELEHKDTKYIVEVIAEDKIA